MGILRKLLAVLLALIALVLAFHFVGSEIYGAYLSQPNLVWDYLNWLLALGVLITLVYHFQRKRALDRSRQDDRVTFDYLSTNLLLFGAIFLALWFLANWFEGLTVNESTPPTVVGFVWLTFNSCFVALGMITAWLLWNDGYGSGEIELSGGQQGGPSPAVSAGPELQPGSRVAGGQSVQPSSTDSTLGSEGASSTNPR